MAGFTRRFASMPDAATLSAIEGVVIVDTPPAGQVVSAGSGTVCLVGEFEDGGFATDPATPVDLFHPAGGLIAITSPNKWSDTVGTLGFPFNGVKNQYPCAVRSLGEWWNGNAYVQAKDLSFRRFLVARVDTSVGSVTFSPLAWVESSNAAPFALTTGQTLTLKVDGGATATATFTGVAATVTGAAASFATLTPGEYVDLSFDAGATVRTTFQSGDITIALVIARINAAFGSTVASNAAGQLALTSPTGGLSSKVIVVGGSTGTLTKLGISAGTTSGTGNVQNIGAVTQAEAKTVIAGATGGATAPICRTPASGKIRVASPTGVTGSIQIIGGTAVNLGLAVNGSAITATSGTKATSIPTGTVCSVSSTNATRVVTMQTLQVPANTLTSISVRVRPAIDDGSYAGASATTITTIETIPSVTSEWAVTNAQLTTAALTDAAKDAAYIAAINATKGMSGPRRKINHVVSARQSIMGRAQLRQNALDASKVGYGRRAFTAPPLGTSLANMTNGTTAPAVGGLRDERVWYVPGFRKYIPEIAALGSALGGGGFTDTGVVEVHGDIVAASLCSLLNPEENPAQATSYVPSTYVDVESALQSWDEPDYELAKSNGIMAPFFDENEGAQFGSGVTSVDPASYPSQAAGARAKMADFCTDTMADFDRPYVKKLQTLDRQNLLLTKTQEFLQGLKDAQRIKDFRVNPGASPVRNVFVIDWAVEMLEEFGSIVNRTAIGQGVIAQTTVAPVVSP